VARSILVIALLPLVAACSKPAPAPDHDPKPAPESADGIPVAPLSGKIRGQTFSLKNARYYVDVRPGYEKFEIYLASSSVPSQCDDLETVRATTVWLRRSGPGGPKPETARFGPGDNTPWEAHYEVFEDGKWTSDGHASALVVLRSVTADAKLDGQLSVNFGDPSSSRVQGEFSAVYCPIRIDRLVRGTHALEVPGKGQGADWQPVNSADAGGSEWDASDDAASD
jgi:hypothetical protein